VNSVSPFHPAHGCVVRVPKDAFLRAGVDCNACRTEDRGDGVLVLVPACVPKARLATVVLAQLGLALRGHNAGCSARARLRLRVALHAGEVHYDDHGVTGNAVNLAFRLVDLPESKAALETSPGLLAIIVSNWFYDEVIRHYPAAEPGSYRRVHSAWIRLPA
jgi:class 3 adenylate cyclase